MAAAREEGESSKAAGEPSLEDLLRSLDLKGEDIGGVAVGKEEIGSLKEGAKWMAVMRLLTTKKFSSASLKTAMLFAWAPAQEVTFHDLEDNRFLVQASCLGDCNRITEQGPWIFRDHGLKFDGSCTTSTVR
jgi:hypothetical protein